MRLTARKGSRGLTYFNISESDVKKRAELSLYLRNAVKKAHSLLDRHFKHVVNALALVLDLKGVAVVSFSITNVAFHVYVGQEIHLNALDAVALARLAPTAPDVEGEASCAKAPCRRDLGLGKEVTYVSKQSRVGRGVGARSSSYRALVDGDNLVKMLESLDSFDLSGVGIGAVQLLCERVVKH